MSDTNKTTANRILGDLDPNGCTNLWSGLVEGLDIFGQTNDKKNATLLLLTDGEPTETPEGGYLSALENKLERDGLPCVVHTFGFGYSMDSKLLAGLAELGMGKFSFIPDCSLVGTVFVNAMSNILSTAANMLTLTLEPLHGSSFVFDAYGRLGGHQVTRADGKVTLKLGTMIFGQQTNIVFQMASLPDPNVQFLKVKLNYHPVQPNSAENRNKEVELTAWRSLQDDAQVKSHFYRISFVDHVREVINFMHLNASTEAHEKLTQLIKLISGDDSLSGNDFLQNLLKDLEGQVTEAISKTDWFSKWGQHYLPSLVTAHLYQQCNNFKDPGIQGYGGELFDGIRSKLDDLFLLLPPPQPSNRNLGYGGYGAYGYGAAGGAAPAPAAVNMRQYYNCNSG
eukprot:TRINITY_DN967_c0_g2_i2.p1 TRINITY_DN967_c0_g2~~TRINITY_DN967_c0_g2_i2.p1  ORF type:complete len:396 (+),score=76.24 TRINITY_DN967_c0_g2_i2:409-1596(+)